MQKNQQKRERAAELMLAGQTDKEISKKLDVDNSTVWRWRNSTEISARLAAERNRRNEALHDEMLKLADDAIDVVAGILRDEKASMMVKLKAAALILDRVGLNPQAATVAVQRDRTVEHSRAHELDMNDGIFGGLGLV